MQGTYNPRNRYRKRLEPVLLCRLDLKSRREAVTEKRRQVQEEQRKRREEEEIEKDGEVNKRSQLSLVLK